MVGASISSLALIKRALPRGLMKHLPPRCQVPDFGLASRLGALHKKAEKRCFWKPLVPATYSLVEGDCNRNCNHFLCPIAKFVNFAKTYGMAA
jgi:hypothetical protein